LKRRRNWHGKLFRGKDIRSGEGSTRRGEDAKKRGRTSEGGIKKTDERQESLAEAKGKYLKKAQ